MRAKREWERVRSPHALFLEGLQAAVASHPSASARVGTTTVTPSPAPRTALTVVGSPDDNVVPLPTDRSGGRRKQRSRGRSGRGGSPAA
jgi:hypothetical protein